MGLSERAEEILEAVWIRTVEEQSPSIAASELAAVMAGLSGADAVARGEDEEDTRGHLEELLSAGYVSETAGNVVLTERGRPLAEDVVRRHRLAERLLADVLDAWNEVTHEKACRFEHLLDRGLDDSICSLLGHPKVCPHGKPIPPGKCCLERREFSARVVSPLSRLVEGQSGKVAYIYAPQLGQLQKLTAMGILPGALLSVVQSFPAHVFQVGNTQFAVDDEIADAIYVRLTGAETPVAAKPSSGHGRHRHGWRWRRKGGLGGHGNRL